HRMEFLWRSESLDRAHTLARERRRIDLARAFRNAVHQDRASAAVPLAAAVLCTREPQLVAQKRQQFKLRLGFEFLTLAIQKEFHVYVVLRPLIGGQSCQTCL